MKLATEKDTFGPIAAVMAIAFFALPLIMLFVADTQRQRL